jgi:hypothetical protein
MRHCSLQRIESRSSISGLNAREVPHALVSVVFADVAYLEIKCAKLQIPKPDARRAESRLIQEARALYESVIPTEKGSAGLQQETPAQTWVPHSQQGLAAAGPGRLCFVDRNGSFHGAIFHRSRAIASYNPNSIRSLV